MSDFVDFPLENAFHFIEPGPVMLLSTAYKGKQNIMTLSWSTLIDFDPIICCIVSEGNASYEALKCAKECVLAIPAIDIMEKVVGIGNCSGKNGDKFGKFNLTPISAKTVKAPLIKECLANIECKIIDINEEYGMFVMKGIKAWLNKTKEEKRTFHAIGNGTFLEDGRKVDLKHLMTKWPQFL